MFDWSEDVVSSSFGTVNSHVPYILSNKIMCKDMSRSLQFPTLVRSMIYSLIYQCLCLHEYTWYLTHTHLVFQSLTQCRSMEMVAHRARPPVSACGFSCGDSYDHPYGSPCCHNLSNKWPLSSKPCCMYLCNKSPDHLITCMHETKRCWKCSLFGQSIIYMSGFILFYLLRALYSFWGHFFWWWISPKCWCWGSSSKLVPGRVGILKDI